MVSSAYCLPVIPTVTTRMIDAEPITMPSMVSRNRALLARKLSTASEITSRYIMVLRALASVLSNDFVSSSGFGNDCGRHGSSIGPGAPESGLRQVDRPSEGPSGNPCPDTAIRHSSVIAAVRAIPANPDYPPRDERNAPRNPPIDPSIFSSGIVSERRM